MALSAQQKFACPACGAEAVWTPSKQALLCPYCGTESPAELASDGSGIVEHDLAKARLKEKDIHVVPFDLAS